MSFHAYSAHLGLALAVTLATLWSAGEGRAQDILGVLSASTPNNAFGRAFPPGTLLLNFERLVDVRDGEFLLGGQPVGYLVMRVDYAVYPEGGYEFRARFDRFGRPNRTYLPGYLNQLTIRGQPVRDYRMRWQGQVTQWVLTGELQRSDRFGEALFALDIGNYTTGPIRE